MFQKGFSQIALIVLVTALFSVLSAGFFVINRPLLAPAPAPTPKACTQEAKLCPDGSYVGRTGSNCEFAACPNSLPPAPVPIPVPKPVPNPAGLECKKDSDCPSSKYVCEAIQAVGTAYPNNSQPPTYTIIKGVCKLKEGNKCSANSDCFSGLLCNNEVCVNPIGRLCAGAYDNSCPTGFDCVQGCGPPVQRQDDPPPPYFCQLKGFVRMCPICLSENTLIETPSGAIPIQQLEKGMSVWTINKSGERVLGEIVATSRVPVSSNHRMVKLNFYDGRELLVSPGHPIIDGRTVADLSPGDYYDGSYVVNAKIVPYGREATYDILPSGDTGFYRANGVLLGSTLRR